MVALSACLGASQICYNSSSRVNALVCVLVSGVERHMHKYLLNIFAHTTPCLTHSGGSLQKKQLSLHLFTLQLQTNVNAFNVF